MTDREAPDQLESPEADPRQGGELVTFQTPGPSGLLFSKPGSTVDLGRQNLGAREGTDTVIVMLHGGISVALGRGYAVILPSFKEDTGEFSDSGASLHREPIPAERLPEIVIGQSWEFTGSGLSSVRAVLTAYSDSEEPAGQAQGLEFANPFVGAEEILETVASQYDHPA